jgi:plastocyanin
MTGGARRAALVAVVAVVGLAGVTLVLAGGWFGVEALNASAPKPATHTVTIDASRFEPARLRVHVGDTVVWTNKDLIPHTATAKDGAFDSDTLAAGASWRFTVTAKGATDYVCRFHPTMAGRIDAD